MKELINTHRRLYSAITNIYLTLFIFCSLGITNNAFGNGQKDIQKYTSNLPFDMPNMMLPQFPDISLNIKDYGAVGDGHTVNTEAFARAIQACAEAGGGRVNVPSGIWFTGPIMLQSNINLHVEKGAVILFSGNFNDYPVIRTSWEGLPEVRCVSPIYGINLENIAITGQGIIDGSGDAWRPVKKSKMTERQWKELLESGGAVNNDGSTWWPSEHALQGKKLVEELDKQDNVSLEEYAAAREYLRPVLVSLVKCKKILLDGPTFQNSPAWNIHPLMCEDVVIRNINIRNPWYSQNGDGLDLESCRNAVVYDCCFDVGDDAICLKSGRNEYGRQRGIASENISIGDCIVYHGHGGFTIGSEMSGGVRNISIRDCVFMGTDVGLRFKSTRGRGGVVENIFINNILMEDIPTDAIRFNMFYQGKAPSPEDEAEDVSVESIPPVTEETPSFQKIYINDIICKNANQAVFLQGLPEMAIKQIELNNVFITANTGLTCIDADQIKMNNVKIIPKSEPVLSFYNSSNVEIQNTKFPEDMEVFIKLAGKKTHGIYLKDVELSQMKEHIEFSKGVKADAVQFKGGKNEN